MRLAVAAVGRAHLPRDHHELADRDRRGRHLGPAAFVDRDVERPEQVAVAAVRGDVALAGDDDPLQLVVDAHWQRRRERAAGDVVGAERWHQCDLEVAVGEGHQVVATAPGRGQGGDQQRGAREIPGVHLVEHASGAGGWGGSRDDGPAMGSRTRKFL